ncbi:VIT1/CCC1 transporter family protein [Marinovum sp.]|uniref:VIT1/CCC1 transporter family protein n=1 Tax=Marinovum sp. TaxID=2024839 RepID=UPI003A8FA382
MTDHGHSQTDIAARLSAPPAAGHLRDAIYGGIDGSVTTFAIVAGVAGAGLSPFVIVALGLANVLADGFSMAAGNYSGTKAELDNARRLRQVEEDHLRRFPEGERLELKEILRAKGLSGATLEAATEEISRNRERWIAMMMEGEYGVGAIEPHPLRAALVTFAAFLVAGMIPLLPFIFALPQAFALSAVLTFGIFFGIGAAKSHWSLAKWWASGGETLLIGGTAASIAYVVGTFFAA